jgi:hypothetical protein
MILFDSSYFSVGIIYYLSFPLTKGKYYPPPWWERVRVRGYFGSMM